MRNGRNILARETETLAEQIAESPLRAGFACAVVLFVALALSNGHGALEDARSFERSSRVEQVASAEVTGRVPSRASGADGRAVARESSASGSPAPVEIDLGLNAPVVAAGRRD